MYKLAPFKEGKPRGLSGQKRDRRIPFVVCLGEREEKGRKTF